MLQWYKRGTAYEPLTTLVRNRDTLMILFERYMESIIMTNYLIIRV